MSTIKAISIHIAQKVKNGDIVIHKLGHIGVVYSCGSSQRVAWSDGMSSELNENVKLFTGTLEIS